MDEYLYVPEHPRSTEADVRAAARVVAGYARDADDLGLLLDRLGIDRPQPEPEPEPEELPRLPCSRQAWSEFRLGVNGRRRLPSCPGCGSVFKAWHKCHIPQ